MPFNDLLMTCLLVSERSFSESGVRVSVQTRQGEEILFFRLDQESYFRQRIGKSNPICDLLIFYAHKDKQEKILCLIELKGRDVNHAVEQIIATKQSLESNGLKDFSANIIWKAYIRIHGSAPINLKEKNMDGLEQVFGKRNYRVRRDQDVGAFLRSDK